MENSRDIDEIIERVIETFPQVNICQLKVTHPADDDGIWYFWLGESSGDDIQIENSYGKCPFLIETNRSDERRWGNSVDETVNIVCEHLRTSKQNDE